MTVIAQIGVAGCVVLFCELCRLRVTGVLLVASVSRRCCSALTWSASLPSPDRRGLRTAGYGEEGGNVQSSVA